MCLCNQNSVLKRREVVWLTSLSAPSSLLAQPSQVARPLQEASRFLSTNTEHITKDVQTLETQRSWTEKTLIKLKCLLGSTIS